MTTKIKQQITKEPNHTHTGEKLTRRHGWNSNPKHKES